MGAICWGMEGSPIHSFLNSGLERLVQYRMAHPGTAIPECREEYRMGLQQVSRYILRKRRVQTDAVQEDCLDAVIDLAIRVHGKQPRKTGPLYLTHPIELAHGEADIGAEWEELLISVLHDAGEHQIKGDAQVQELRSALREGENPERIRQQLIRRSASIAKEFLDHIQETLLDVLDRHGIDEDLARDRFRWRVERVLYGVYQLTRLEGISEGEYLDRLLYGRRTRTRGSGTVPICEDLREFIRDPREHGHFELEIKQTASIKLKDNTVTIRETPRRYEDPRNRYTVAEMTYLVFKYTTVVAAVTKKIKKLRRNDVQKRRLEQSCEGLLQALREENAKDLTFLECVLTAAEQQVVRWNVERYCDTAAADHPHRPRYNWKNPREAVTAMGKVYGELVAGKVVDDPFYPIEGFTFRNWRMMNGDKRWLEELADVRDPGQRERGVHLIAYQDALLNRFTFDNPVRHLAYLDVVFGRRWKK